MTPSIIVGGVLVVWGGTLGVSSLRELLLARASRRWPTTRGLVRDKGGHQGSMSRGDSFVVVEYAYTVEGIEYVSRRYDYAGRASQRTFGGFPELPDPGDRVEVYFDPDEPSRSVLVPGPRSINYLLTALGFIGGAAGALIVLAGL